MIAGVTTPGAHDQPHGRAVGPRRQRALHAAVRLPPVARAVAIVVLVGWTITVVRDAPRPVLTGAVGVAAVMTLWIQRRRPLITLIAALGGLALAGRLGFEGPDDPFLVVVLWASYGVGRYADRRLQPWAAAGVLFLLSITLAAEDVRLPGDVVFPVLFTAAPWVLGLVVQLAGRREREAHDTTAELVATREQELRRATHEERVRIARELHDVAAHAMSAVSLQAQVMRRRIEAGERVGADAAREIEDAARAALDELRHVVGVLRPTPGSAALAPQPSIDDLAELLRRCEAVGQRVAFDERGARVELPDGLSLSAYRIVQEALANARQHGPDGGRADVAIRWERDTVRLMVRSPLGPRPTSGGTGHGLVGMRERASLFGGKVSAGPTTDGSWLVDARLPLRQPGRAFT
ncbi:MAG: hypothetical protein KY461_15775 [Actinobacteria bacterium]|nr:hypothetical protein [Actinomycetota bacterium]